LGKFDGRCTLEVAVEFAVEFAVEVEVEVADGMEIVGAAGDGRALFAKRTLLGVCCNLS
jgi:hypothetical protein